MLLFLLACAPLPGDIVLRSGPLPCCTDAEDGRWAVRLSSPARATDRARLEAQGLTVEAPLPGGFLVTGAPQPSPRIGWSAAWTDAARFTPELWSDDDDLIAVVELFRDADADAVADDLWYAGLVVEGAGGGRVIVRGPASAIRSVLSGRAAVAWVSRRPQRRLHNDTTAWVGQSGATSQQVPFYDELGLDGAGQVAAVLDSGLDADGCWFADAGAAPLVVTDGGADVDEAHRKLRAVDFLWDADDPGARTDWDDHGHGTHVAGTVAGDRGTRGVRDSGDGLAPAATLVIQDGGFVPDPKCTDLAALGCPVTHLDAVLQQAYDQGARVHTNSWGDIQGTATPNIYTDATEDIDRFTWTHPDMLVLFAGGNDGPWPETVSNPSTAKNTLSVAATMPGGQAGALASFSSRGPTDDGRIKPDVAFPGYAVTSAGGDLDAASDNCDTAVMSGTSMASPGAAAVALLVRQFYEARRGISPSGALVKATLIHSAAPMAAEPPPPSSGQGWGRVQLDRVIPLADSPWSLDVLDRQEAPLSHAVDVASAAAPLSVTLAWADYPSTPVAAIHLVNDLDLTVTAPDGTVYLGNVFDDDGASAPGGEADRRNNVERVWIEAPQPGTWTVAVSDHAIAEGPQPLSLVITAQRGPPQGGDTSEPADTDTDHDTDADAPADTAAAVPGEGGCGCSSAPRPVAGLLAAVLLGLLRRRR